MKASRAIGRNRRDSLRPTCRKGKRKVGAGAEPQGSDPRIVHSWIIGKVVEAGPGGLASIVRGEPRKIGRENEIIVGG